MSSICPEFDAVFGKAVPVVTGVNGGAPFVMPTVEYLYPCDPASAARFLAILKEKGFSLDELGQILQCSDNMLINSCAGSGKTTTLLFKLIYDILIGRIAERVPANGVDYIRVRPTLVCTFLKSGAEELAARFDELCREYHIVGVTSKQITFCTLHSEAYAVLKQIGIPLQLETDTIPLVRQACKLCKVTKRKSPFGGYRPLTVDDYVEIQTLLSYVQNRLDSSRYEHPIAEDFEFGQTDIELLLDAFRKCKVAAEVQDFDDLEYLLLNGYSRYPAVRDYVKSRYEYLFIDEFQDVSQLQYEVFRPYFEGAKGFICLGDDDQCIYSWRGSDVRLISGVFEKDWPVSVYHLSTNYRCGTNILQAVVPSIEQNTVRHDKKLQSAVPGGEIVVHMQNCLGSLTDCFTGPREGSLAILGRTNSDLLIPFMRAVQCGCPVLAASKGISFTRSYPKVVFGLTELVSKRYTAEFSRYLRVFASGARSYEVTKLCDVLANDPTLSLFTIDQSDVRYSAPSLASVVRTLQTVGKDNPKECYIALLKLFDEKLSDSDSLYATECSRFVRYVLSLLKTEPLKSADFGIWCNFFFTVLPASLKNAQQAASNPAVMSSKTNGCITFMTVHEAKGKEWDTVLLWNDFYGCFPSVQSTASVKGSIEKSGWDSSGMLKGGPGPGEPDEKVDLTFEEERRVHYIAWTRARRKLIVFTDPTRLKGSFLKECILGDALRSADSVEGEAV